MVKNPFHKDVYREIIRTSGRFISIFAIVALGVAFYAGIGATGDIMKQAGDIYFKETKLMDIRVVSTYGFNKKDVEAIRQAEGVAAVHPSYQTDVLASNNEYSASLKVHSVNPDAGMNDVVVIEGRLPEKPGEFAAEGRITGRLGVSLGDRVKFASGKKADIRSILKTDSATLVGIVRSPLYISLERGSGGIGNGTVDCYAYITEDSFLSDVYTEVYLRVAGADTLMCFSDEYGDLIKAAKDGLEDTGEREAARRLGQITASALGKLDVSEAEAEAGASEMRHAFEDTEAKLNASRDSIRKSKAELALRQFEINEALQSATENDAALHAGASELRHAITQAEDAVSLLTGQGAAADDMEKLLEELRASETGLNQNTIDLAATRAQLMEAEREIYNAYGDLSAAEKELQALRDAFNLEKVSALEAAENGISEIKEARQALLDLDEPEWFVLDRDSNPGYAGYADDTDKIIAIGRYFPLIFFIVAALVSLTTMTRLVEEKRTEIGALKSMGYGGPAIISKYIIYGFAPTIVGGALGGLAGMRIFPDIIRNAYAMLYSVPTYRLTVYSDVYALGLFMAVASTTSATVLACAGELRETPANLMRPRAPKAGKRIWLEYIPFIWNRFSFSLKVTIRNIFRYKKRFYMTVIGIGGCTSLLLTGFGLYDSFSGVINKQFGEISHVDMAVSFGSGASQKDLREVETLLNQSPLVSSQLKLRQKKMTAESYEGVQEDIVIMAADDINELRKFYTFRERLTGEPVHPPAEGAIISERAARVLGVSAGSYLTVDDGDNIKRRVRLAGVTENYIYNYLYMGDMYYADVFGEAPEYNTISVIFNSYADESSRDALAGEVIDKRGVGTVSFTSSMVNTFNDTIKSLNVIVFVLIVSAGLLAFIVLLNLTNINISERMREIATIEVLGFYDAESSAYIYRENIALTLTGGVVGLFLGVYIHGVIIVTVETGMLMFNTDIFPMSYALSMALTLLFSVCVSILTSGKIRNINMVEALKSVE